MEPTNRIRIELTDAQRKQIKDQSGEDVQSLEFNTKELEQRIAPVYMKFVVQDVSVSS